MIPQEFLSYPLQMDMVKRKTLESLRTTFHIIYLCITIWSYFFLIEMQKFILDCILHNVI